MYYKLKFTYETARGHNSFITYMQVFSDESFNEAIQDIVKEKNIPSNYAVKSEKTTLKKLIEEEKRHVLDELGDEYLALRYGSDIFLSTEYTKLKLKQSKDHFAVRNLYADLKKYLCACREIRQTVDIAKITVAEFNKMVLELINSDTSAADSKYIN